MKQGIKIQLLNIIFIEESEEKVLSCNCNIRLTEEVRSAFDKYWNRIILPGSG